MQTNVNLELPKQFVEMCHYSQQKPEEVLQAIANEISYPLFLATTDRNKKLATYFFIQHIQSPDFKGQINESLEEHYFSQMSTAIDESYKQYPNDEEKAIEVANTIMETWAKAAIAERGRYLTDDL